MFGFSRRSAVALGMTSVVAALGELPGRVLAQSPAGSAEQRLRELGIVLPTVTAVNPAAHIVPYVRTGKLLFVSGLGPGGNAAKGKVGKEITADEATQLARQTGLNILARVRQAVGSLDNVARVVKVLGMVNSTPEFTDQPTVINGCSDLFIAIFGDDRGKHARSAVGMVSLGFGGVVEIESVFELV
jgi:enamine deaminase RidA (YjgF/YER057c/UK114 family)